MNGDAKRKKIINNRLDEVKPTCFMDPVFQTRLRFIIVVIIFYFSKHSYIQE